ncbi:histidine kinase [Paenibacillus alvei TS-15]|uniref:Histidine kinase n=1 Tax=Paenibacillus alvei TS-15 TaxID=1117108 RepID=S9U3H7_PAEAL|nr:histidine kinase [Paenibacillus alvei TS-15]
MKKGIVFKLFVLTTALCLLILAIIYFGQTVFFKKYYIHQKVENVKASLDTFAQNYVNQVNDSLELWRLEEEFLSRAQHMGDCIGPIGKYERKQ